jgi:hypothetical protein
MVRYWTSIIVLHTGLEAVKNEYMSPTSDVCTQNVVYRKVAHQCISKKSRRIPVLCSAPVIMGFII